MDQPSFHDRVSEWLRRKIVFLGAYEFLTGRFKNLWRLIVVTLILGFIGYKSFVKPILDRPPPLPYEIGVQYLQTPKRPCGFKMRCE